MVAAHEVPLPPVNQWQGEARGGDAVGSSRMEVKASFSYRGFPAMKPSRGGFRWCLWKRLRKRGLERMLHQLLQMIKARGRKDVCGRSPGVDLHLPPGRLVRNNGGSYFSLE